MSVEGGDVERRVGVLVNGVDGGAVFEQRLGARVTPVDRGQVERRPTVESLGVHLGALLQ